MEGVRVFRRVRRRMWGREEGSGWRVERSQSVSVRRFRATLWGVEVLNRTPGGGLGSWRRRRSEATTFVRG